MEPTPITVRYTPYRYTGWRRVWRKLTFRPVESPTYEFEAIFPGTYDLEDSVETYFEFKPVGPIRRVSP